MRHASGRYAEVTLTSFHHLQTNFLLLCSHHRRHHRHRHPVVEGHLHCLHPSLLYYRNDLLHFHLPYFPQFSHEEPYSVVLLCTLMTKIQTNRRCDQLWGLQLDVPNPMVRVPPHRHQEYARHLLGCFHCQTFEKVRVQDQDEVEGRRVFMDVT